MCRRGAKVPEWALDPAVRQVPLTAQYQQIPSDGMSRVTQAALSISLPKSLRRVVERRVRDGGFGNVSEYIRALIRADEAAVDGESAVGQRGQLPGIGVGKGGPSGRAVHERSPTVAGMARVDFGAAQWRELREMLLAGELALVEERLAEASELFHTMLAMRRAALRREMPRAKAGQIEAALAGWLREQCAEPEDQALRSAPERLARFQHG